MTHFFVLLQKDLLVGWRGRSRLVGLVTYGTSLLLLFSFALGADSAVLREHAAAYLWVALLSASTLLLAQSFQHETEAGALEGLLLVPVSPMALYYAKATANLVLLLFLAVALFPLTAVLFDLQGGISPLRLAAVVTLGSAGLVGPGTLYAALTARLASKQVMLPVLLFPLVIPPVVASVKGTQLALTGDPMGQLVSWLSLLLIFDLLYWSLGGILLGKVLDE
ncbi:MAG: heme exporter protein CcmB [Deltaproteobacteria bacterium]|nr:heme exporter protein CcmB [Deltaproteobacteria bacterium]